MLVPGALAAAAGGASHLRGNRKRWDHEGVVPIQKASLKPAHHFSHIEGEVKGGSGQGPRNISIRPQSLRQGLIWLVLILLSLLCTAFGSKLARELQDRGQRGL